MENIVLIQGIIIYILLLSGIILLGMMFYRFIVRKITKGEKKSGGKIFIFISRIFKYSLYLLLIAFLLIFLEPIFNGLFGF